MLFAGSYNDAPKDSGECTLCAEGFTTSGAGSDKSDLCNVCQAGYGGTTCATKCGGLNGPQYGPAARPMDTPACEACPLMTVGFSFDYLAQNKPYTPAPVARTGAASAADCLAEFAQIEDAAWYMAGDAALLTNVTDSVSSNTFQACADFCKGSSTCQYITYDYETSQCFVKYTVAGAQT